MTSLLLDTNVLLLFLVGSKYPDRIGTKRLKAFDVAHLDKVIKICRDHRVHITLPNILTEVSNFLGSGQQQLVPDGVETLRDYCGFVREMYVPSPEVVSDPVFSRLGLTDTAILRLADEKVEVLTIDFQLHGRLIEKGVKAVNILHFRT